MSLDVAALRAHVPAVAGPGSAAHFDAPGGTQTPDVVAESVAAALLQPMANRGVHTAAERNADRIVVEARSAIADLLGVPAGTVVFGRSATQLTFDLARTLAAGWSPGDRIVVTRLDHDANIRPWYAAAARVGAQVVMVDFDPTTAELPAEAFDAAIDERTRLVACTAASNLVGTRPDIAAIAARAHAVGALLHVDGVHATAHGLVDLPSCGADLYVCSPYKFLGPHHGVLAAADPTLLEALHPDKLAPSSDAVPERFELGTLPYELLAGTRAAVDFLASWGTEDRAAPAPGPTRRAALGRAWAQVEAHELALRTRIEEALADLPEVTVYSRAAERTPTLLFSSARMASDRLYAELAARGVNAPAGSFYALEASRHLGLGDTGAVRVGLAPYNDDSDVDRLVAALRELIG